jgi:nitronate monooxygenase
MIGGGYGDADWIEREFAAAGKARVGCGFITWSLAKHPAVLDIALAHAPVAVMLSFGPPAPFVPRIKAAGALAVCQVQTLEHAREAVGAGADIVVAQGADAGGHGMVRATFTLVPEVADYLAVHAPATVLVAAGGIADGRGLAAALMLGADGVLVGSRFVASAEALVDPASQGVAVAVDGDSTRRTAEVDIARGTGWPAPFTGRALETDEPATARPDAVEQVGEAAGLIHDVRPAGDLLRQIVGEAERLLAETAPGFVRRA